MRGVGLPVSHDEQVKAPSSAEYLPAEHSLHVEAPAAVYWPAEHSVHTHSLQMSATCHWATKPSKVRYASLVNLTLMTPEGAVKLLLEDTEDPLRIAGSDGESHDVAPRYQLQPYINS